MPRKAPLDMSPEQFRQIGHQLVDDIAGFIGSLPDRPVTTGEPPSKIQELVGTGSLPIHGSDAGELVRETSELLFNHSLFNGHPKFLGYITSSAAPIGMLADMLAAAINPNVGGWSLSPVATEIERQTIRWIAELVGYNTDCGGVLVSGGNMANMTCFLAARKAKASWPLTKEGMSGGKSMIVYCSAETHTWINKAVDIAGMGTDAVRWIETDTDNRINVAALRLAIRKDTEKGKKPFMVIGTAGSVSTGAIDPLRELSEICQKHDLWFHVDGAYGAFAACTKGADDDLKSLHNADSMALDPHKWLYAPLEVGCALVRNEETLSDTFSFHPPYYKFDGVAGEKTVSMVDFSLQNSRGFRALKVWLALRQVGREGYEQMISDDISLSKKMADAIKKSNELELFSQSLSIVTFRYVPNDLDILEEKRQEYLNDLNTRILTIIQEGGELFLSNAIIGGDYLLRACIVNFRTDESDVSAVSEIITRVGREVSAETH